MNHPNRIQRNYLKDTNYSFTKRRKEEKRVTECSYLGFDGVSLFPTFLFIVPLPLEI